MAQPGRRIGVFALVLSAVLLGVVSLGHSKGPGLRAGALEIHPSFTAGAGYDSNFWRESRYEASAPVNPVTVVRFGGGISVENRNPNNAGLELELSAMGRYARAEDPDGTMSDLDDSVGLDTAKAKVGISILPKKPVTIDVKADARYTERPATEMLKEDGYQRLIASFGPDFRFRPGGRPGNRALELRLGYRFSLDRSVGTSASVGGVRGDKDTHQLSFLTHWRFFPKTALLLDVRYGMINYRTGIDVDVDGQPVDGPNKDLNPLRAEIGLQGLVSRRLALTIRGGYSNSYNDNGESYVGAIGRFNLDYTLEPVLKLGMGYALKLGDDSFSNYYTLHRGFVKGNVNLPAKFSIGGKLGLDYYVYSRDGAPAWSIGLPDRVEPIMRAMAEIGWNPVNWLAFKASWEFENNRSDFYYCLGETPGRCFANDPIDLASYSRHVVMLSVASEY